MSPRKKAGRPDDAGDASQAKLEPDPDNPGHSNFHLRRPGVDFRVWGPTELLTDCVTADLARRYDEQARLRDRLAAAAAIVGPPPCPATSRGGRLPARIQIRGGEILLDGEVVPLDTTADCRGALLCLLTHLLTANGNWLTGPELNALIRTGPYREYAGVRWDRKWPKLPPPLLSLFESSKHKGYRLVPAAWRE